MAAFKLMLPFAILSVFTVHTIHGEANTSTDAGTKHRKQQPSSTHGRGMQGDQNVSARRLQEILFRKDPPKRQCGEIIHTTSKDDILSMFEAFNKALFLGANNPGLEALVFDLVSSPVQYGVQARVVCGTCADALDRGDDLVQGSSATNHGFLTFCGPDRFAHNVTFSALAMIPIDATTLQPLTGRLKSFVTSVGVNGPQQDVPSQMYPNDFSFFRNANSTFVVSMLEALAEIFPGLLGASSGVIGIIPDYIGYGHSYMMPRSLAVKHSYQRVGTATWFATEKLVNQISGGCTVMDRILTLSGSSEGGYAAFAQALAFRDMGFTVLSTQLGTAPFRLDHQIAWAFEKLENQTATESLTIMVPFLGVAYSSTNPDLPNTNRNQDLLNTVWMDPINKTQNVVEWMRNDQTPATLKALIPSAPLEMIDPATIQLIKRFCDMAVAGETDLLCQALVANNLIPELEGTPFPVSLCFSPEDDVISFGNQPDYTKSDLLTEFKLFGQTASGNHLDATAFCLFNQILPFTTLRLQSTPAPNSIDPLTEGDVCHRVSQTEFPTSAPTPAQQSSGPSMTTNQVNTAIPSGNLQSSVPTSSSNSKSRVWTLFLMVVPMIIL